MSENKRYEIETLEQLINIVTSENYERLATDFLYWLDFANQTFEELKKEPQNKGKQNCEIAKVKFIWVDDGKAGLTGVKLTNTATGEVKHKIINESTKRT